MNYIVQPLTKALYHELYARFKAVKYVIREFKIEIILSIILALQLVVWF